MSLCINWIKVSEVAMQKSVLYGIIAAVVIAAGIGVAFAAMSMNSPVANQTSGPSDDVRVIKHLMGETEIEGTPERIVALDWSASENLLAMGIQPIAVADLEGMKKFLKPEGLPPDVVDLGMMQEPNLERISELEPDLIFAEKFSHSNLYDELESIAPTIMYDNAPPLDGSPTHLESLEQNIMLVADAANRHDKGTEIVERLHAKYDEAAARIEAAGLKGTKYVAGAVDPPYGEYTTFTLRFFDNTFFMSQIISKTGLENAVTEEYGLANWGMKQVGLEGLATVDGPDVHIFYIHAAGQDAFENEWRDNPVWNNLEIAKDGNAHSIGQLYVYGGAKQMEEMVDRIVQEITDSSSTRTISHAMGETEITGTPERIVALSWSSGGDLITLGIQPVGIANKGLFNELVNLDEVTLSPDVADVGLPWEPNLETIAQLEPDLIIGAMHDHELIYDDLNDIAPTLLFHVFVQSPDQGIPTELELMEQNFMTIADVVGRHDQGVAVLEGMNAKFDEAAGKLADAGLEDSKFVMAYVRNDASTMWIWIDAMWTQVLERMGLENAYKAAYDEEYEFGGVALGLEGLSIVDDPEVHFIFREHPTDTGIPDSWQDNPVWNGLEFVKAGQAYPHEAMQVYAGPLAAERLADRVVELLAGDSS